jgi:hypothetical protein
MAHRDAVLELAPHRLHRTFTLGEAARLVSEHNARTVTDLSAFRSRLSADRTFDIPDPIGQDAECFSMTGSRIAKLFRRYSSFAVTSDFLLPRLLRPPKLISQWQDTQHSNRCDDAHRLPRTSVSATCVCESASLSVANAGLTCHHGFTKLRGLANT